MALYAYGPPVLVNVPGTPAGATGEVENGGSNGGSPLPPPSSTTVVVPGGSPSTESGQDVNKQSTLTSLTPNTAVHDTGVQGVTVAGTKFTPDSYVMVGGKPVGYTTYMSPTQLSCGINTTGLTAGTLQVTVQTGAWVSAALPFTIT